MTQGMSKLVPSLHGFTKIHFPRASIWEGEAIREFEFEFDESQYCMETGVECIRRES